MRRFVIGCRPEAPTFVTVTHMRVWPPYFTNEVSTADYRGAYRSTRVSPTEMVAGSEELQSPATRFWLAIWDVLLEKNLDFLSRRRFLRDPRRDSSLLVLPSVETMQRIFAKSKVADRVHWAGVRTDTTVTLPCDGLVRLCLD